MLHTMTPSETYRRLQNGEILLIDIRDTDEYTALSIPGAHLIPLSILSRHPVREDGGLSRPVVFTCNSGNRTQKASELLQKVADGEAWQMEGGVTAWEKAGFPVQRKAATSLSLFRQIQIGAGSLVVLGVVGSVLWSPLLWLAGFVGAGLVFAGVSGFCGLGILLSHMPWNRE
ncbi:MAG: rhodanese family protein [Bilophila sp.]